MLGTSVVDSMIKLGSLGMDIHVPSNGFRQGELLQEVNRTLGLELSPSDENWGFIRHTVHRFVINNTMLLAAPSLETLVKVAGILKGKKVVEVNAGRGYISSVLHYLGVDVEATDNLRHVDDFEEPFSILTEISNKDAISSIRPDVDVYIMSWASYQNDYDVAFLEKMREVNPDAQILLISEIDDIYGPINTPAFLAKVKVVDRLEEINDSYKKDSFYGQDSIVLVK